MKTKTNGKQTEQKGPPKKESDKGGGYADARGGPIETKGGPKNKSKENIK